MKHQELIKRIRQFYQADGNICGGNLHILLDDGNIDDDDVEYCRVQAEKYGDLKGLWICMYFSKLSYLERTRIMRGRFGDF